MAYKCPARESSKFLCDRVAEYQIEGTVWCNTHTRRVLDGDDLTVRVREFTTTAVKKQVPTQGDTMVKLKAKTKASTIDWRPLTKLDEGLVYWRPLTKLLEHQLKLLGKR